ncbi:MAG: R3H domain-containing nucleic acid-binding protein, partial [Anaerolineae bacterium]
AVENHNPEVIVIDEIGRELEAMAARTIAERGVQLIATAHGNTLENLLLNPTLSDLVGGIESVTLSDEEARRRGTQKTVLERRAPPTFDVLVEIQDRQRVLVRDDVTQAVDALLRGRPRPEVLRYRDNDGEVRMEQIDWMEGQSDEDSKSAPPSFYNEKTRAMVSRRKLKERRIYPYGVARNRLLRAAQLLHVPIRIVDNLGEAHVMVTSKQYYRKRPHIVRDAESRNVPVYALRASTNAQMEAFLTDLFQLSEEETDPFNLAMQETESAIQKVLAGKEQSIDLAPQNSFVRRYQHEMAERANLTSRSHGKEPYRSVRVFRDS